MSKEINIKIPELHKNQQFILDNCSRFNVCNIGRRFGKDILLNDLAIRNSIDNKRVLITYLISYQVRRFEHFKS